MKRREYTPRVRYINPEGSATVSEECRRPVCITYIYVYNIAAGMSNMRVFYCLSGVDWMYKGCIKNDENHKFKLELRAADQSHLSADGYGITESGNVFSVGSFVLPKQAF